MILTAHQLACRRGGRLIFQNVGFTVRSGEALLITGENGAGKSSLLAIVAGLLAPAAGHVALTTDASAEAVDAIGLVGHRDGLKSQLSVGENLAFARELLGPSGTSVAEGLAAIGMGHAADMRVEILSAGQRRRVAIARLIVCNRPVWLMDEPAAALDAASLRLLSAVMGRHLGNGGIILASTHQPIELPGAGLLQLERVEESDAAADDPFFEDDWDGDHGWPIDAAPRRGGSTAKDD